MRGGGFADLCTRLQHVFEVVVWPSIQLSPTTLLKLGDALPWYGLRKLGVWTAGGHNWAVIRESGLPEPVLRRHTRSRVYRTVDMPAPRYNGQKWSEMHQKHTTQGIPQSSPT